jgi:hypothetical protein
MEDIRFGGVSKEELIGIVQRACATGIWDEVGVRPRHNCKCLERGHLGRSEGKYVVCRCITRQVAFIRSYVIPEGA